MPKALRDLMASLQPIAVVLTIVSILFVPGVAGQTGGVPADRELPRGDHSPPDMNGLSSPEIVWIRQFGTFANEFATGVAVDAEGSVYVVGSRSAFILRGGCASIPVHLISGSGAFLRKFDADGAEMWTRWFGTSSADGAFAVEVDSTGVYVAGATTGSFPGFQNAGRSGIWDPYVRKYDADGNVLWTRQFGNFQHEVAYDIDLDATGVYVAGTSCMPGTIPGAESGRAFVTKLDPDGNLVWTHKFGTRQDDAFGLSVHDGIYFAGRTNGSEAFIRKLSPDGRERWTRQFGTTTPRSIAVDATGVYIAGTFVAFPGHEGTGRPGFVQKHDANGNLLWTRQFGTSDNETAFGIALDGTSVYVAGGTSATCCPDVVVRRYGLDGEEEWTLQFGSSSTDGASDVVVGSSGIYVAGMTGGDLSGQTCGGWDAFLAKLVLDSNAPPTLAEISCNARPTLSAISLVPATAFPGDEITLTATASDTDGDILAFAWDFGDGTSAIGTTSSGGGTIPASQTYGAAGTYTVTLTVDDGKGGGAVQAASVEVLAPPSSLPILSEIVSAPRVALVAEQVRLSASASDPDGDILTYAWNFGDGTGATGTTGPGGGTISVIHAYGAVRTYTVSLSVTDGSGSSTNSATVRVGEPLTVAASIESVSGGAPLTFSFAATGSGGTAPYSFEWDFGDGGISTDQNASHTYAADGTYGWTLTVADADGRTTMVRGALDFHGPPIPPWMFPALIAAAAIGTSGVILWRWRGRARVPPPGSS